MLSKSCDDELNGRQHVTQAINLVWPSHDFGSPGYANVTIVFAPPDQATTVIGRGADHARYSEHRCSRGILGFLWRDQCRRRYYGTHACGERTERPDVHYGCAR